MLRILLVLVALVLSQQTTNSFNFETKHVVIHRPSFSRDSHFGFSVAGYKVDSSPWIIVGAPLTQRDRMHGQLVKSREGAIYRCRIDKPNSCYMLPFDTKDDWSEARDHYGIYYSENKTDQLLGATLKVSDDVIMACAPNYRHIARVLRQDEFREEPTGICYVLRERMRKFEEHSPCRNSLWGHHRQGYCQAGFSAAISKNDSSLFITGPGAWYWQGMVFSINMYNKEIRHRFPSRSGEGKHDDSYRGYAIDTGHFDNDIFEDILVTAPRAHHLKGQVEIFSHNFRLLHTFYGEQIGQYFGASISAVDLNGDRYDDVIIGSPMYHEGATDDYDMGRVDIYIRQLVVNVNGFVFKQITLKGFKAKSRFGTAITKLADVNDDGFNDIAIAAPYDGEDGSGNVYIFAGAAEGISALPIQILKGSDYNLRTFGYSLSGGLDLDGNQYPDLIVGAYKSDAVAYIRTRPVVRAQVTTQTTPRIIDLKSTDLYCDPSKRTTCLGLETCVEYYGKAVPAKLTMQVAIELNVEAREVARHQNQSRAFFGETKTGLLAQNFTFSVNSKACFAHIIHINKNIRDKFNPIMVRLNISLPKFDSDRELMPLFNSQEILTTTHEIRFLRNCGADDICKPDLQLSASSPSLTHVYGSGEHIDLNIKAANVGEDAFEAQCFITLPHGVDYVKAFVNQASSLQQTSSLPCKHNKSLNYENETTVICDIGNPLVAGSSKNFTIRIAPQNILLNQDKLKFNITVTSSNKEDDMAQLDNEKYIYVVMKATPEVALIGKQYNEQVVYETKDFSTAVPGDSLDIEDEIGPEILHEYRLINKGPSQISQSELLIAWQKKLQIASEDRDFLYLMEAPYTEGPIKCQLDRTLINSHNISMIDNDRIENPERYYQSGGQKYKRHYSQPELDNTFMLKSPNNLINMHNFNKVNYYQGAECSFGMTKNTRSFKHEDDKKKSNKNNNQGRFLDKPGSSSFDFYCGSMHCDVGSMRKDEVVMVRLRFRLWSRNLAMKPDIYNIRTYSMAAVTQIPYKKIDLNLDKLQMTTQIETVAYPKERGNILDQIDLQIVLMSVITGIILLLILIIILWSCGFFKRFEPKDMKKLENNVSTSDEDDEEDNASQNDVIDISKDCTKANPSDKVYQADKYQFSLNPEKAMMFKQQQDNNTSYRVPNQMPVHLMPRNDLGIYSSPRLDSNRRQQQQQQQQQFYDHPENQVYGDSNQHKMSTFQQPQQPALQPRLLTVSPPDYPSNEKFMIQNLDGSRIISNSGDYQSNLNNEAQKELLLRLKNQIEENNHYNNSNRTPLLAGSRTDSSDQSTSQQQQHRNSPKTPTYTNKLPPVPRRNSKSSVNTNTMGRTRTLSPLSNQQNCTNSLPRYNNNNNSQNSPGHHQLIITNRDNNSSGGNGHLSPHSQMIAASPSLNKKNFYQKI